MTPKTGWVRQDEEQWLHGCQLDLNLEIKGYDFPEEKNLHIRAEALATKTLNATLIVIQISLSAYLSLCILKR